MTRISELMKDDAWINSEYQIWSRTKTHEMTFAEYIAERMKIIKSQPNNQRSLFADINRHKGTAAT